MKKANQFSGGRNNNFIQLDQVGVFIRRLLDSRWLNRGYFINYFKNLLIQYKLQFILNTENIFFQKTFQIDLGILNSEFKSKS